MDRTMDARVTRKALKGYFPDGRYGFRVHPLPEYGCIYVRNAKAATSTILLWLHRIHTGDHGADLADVHRDHRLPTAGEVGWQRVADMLAGQAFRFSFVRHPLRRVESAYVDKVLRRAQYQGRVGLQRALGIPEDPAGALSAEQFVAGVEASEPINMDAHWRPQHLNLMHPLVTYDHVGRLESFDADLARIAEAVRLPPVPLRVRNATAKRTDSPFTPAQLRRLEKVYAVDFELFGYDT